MKARHKDVHAVLPFKNATETQVRIWSWCGLATAHRWHWIASQVKEMPYTRTFHLENLCEVPVTKCEDLAEILLQWVYQHSWRLQSVLSACPLGETRAAEAVWASTATY